MSKVALVRCESYDQAEVDAAVKRGLALLGGIEKYMAPGEKILLKPNLVAADPPERCSTTHFSVFRAVAELFKNAGTRVEYGDSPAVHSPESVARRCGIGQAAEEVGISLADFHSGREIVFEEGKQNKKFVIANGVLDCDGLVSVPKLKTHGFERITACIKNQFGCIPGTLKGEFHARIPDAISFARMLVDLNCYIRPRLFIVDGIWAMEGNGPRSGNPRKLGVLLFSDDPIALDATICRMISLKPEIVPTVTIGAEQGLGTYDEKNIELLGDPLDSFKIKDFNVKKDPVAAFVPKGITRVVRNSLIPKPYIKYDKCVNCGVCAGVCPVNPKALEQKSPGGKKDKPRYTYSRCIRCYCCQELCPEGAIELTTPVVRRFVHIFRKEM